MNVISRPSTIYFFAGFLSLVLSFYAGFHVDVINRDAVCYLQSAQAMSEGLHFAMHLCGQAQWPFYSVLIFSLAKLTYLSFTESAYLLNSMFSLISVLSFIAIIQFLVSKKEAQRSSVGRILWLAAFVILMAHQFNALRQDIFRDHGFIAFYLLSILFLLNYFQMLKWRYALGWSLSLVIATLFRIEGGVFLLLLPFLTGLDARLTFSSRIKSFLKLQSLAIFIAALLFIWLLIHPLQDLTRINELHYQLLHGWQVVWQNFLMRTDLLTKEVLPVESISDAHLVFFLMLLSWYVIEIIATFSLVYMVFVIYAWWKRVLPADPTVRYVIWGYVIINLIITFAFLVEHLFLSKRYLMPLSLVLMIWVPLALNHLFSQYQKQKWLPIFALILIVLSGLGGIFHFGYSKTYIRDAGDWISKNIPRESKLYSNDYQLKYHSNHFGNAIFQNHNEALSNLKAQQFDYLALLVNKRDQKINGWIQKEIHSSPIKTFANQRGDSIIIYKIKH